MLNCTHAIKNLTVELRHLHILLLLLSPHYARAAVQRPCAHWDLKHFIEVFESRAQSIKFFTIQRSYPSVKAGCFIITVLTRVYWGFDLMRSGMMTHGRRMMEWEP